MKPKAIMLIYQPTHRFRFKKYYLKQNNNIVGSGEQCDIKLEKNQYTQVQKIANIKVSDNLMILQPLSSEVKVSSNMLYKRHFVQLPKSIQYVMEMEKQFFLGHYKCMIQVLPYEELIQIKNVENDVRFLTSQTQKIVKQPSENSDKTQKFEEQDQFAATLALDDGGYQPTVPLENGNFDSTLPLDNYGGYQATLVLQNGGFQTTLPLQIDGVNNAMNMDIEHPQKQKLSQNINPILKQSHQQIIPQSEKHQIRRNQVEEDEDDISMPDTLQQDQMPPTLQEGQQASVNNKKNKREKMPNSAPNFTDSQIQAQGIYKHKSWQMQKNIQKSPLKRIQDFDDLFDIKQSQKKQKKVLDIKRYSSGTQRLQMSNSLKTQMLSNSLNSNQALNNSKVEMVNSKNQADDKKQYKKIAVSNCKLNDIMKRQLAKRGYKLISQANEDYELLIVGNDLKRSTRLMMALIDGKQIKSQSWIYNPNAKINGKIQGFPWQQVQKRKGNKGKIFIGRYYLAQRLHQQFLNVLENGGATIVNDLNGRGKANQQINLIISLKDKDIYDEKKRMKKWKFYDYKMIVESVLVGQQIKEKYLIDDYYF